MQLKNIEEDMIDRITDAVAREMNATRQLDPSRYRSYDPSYASRDREPVSIDSGTRRPSNLDRER
jgi:hypothetical protein